MTQQVNSKRLIRAAMKSSIGWTVFIDWVALGLNAFGDRSTGAAIAALMSMPRFYAHQSVTVQ